MLIGILSQKTGFSRDTIRFYEKKGLFKLSGKDRRENNYKEYSSDILAKLQLIKKFKEFGFTLNEIKDFLKLCEKEIVECENIKPLVLEKVGTIERKIEELNYFKEKLLLAISICDGNCKNLL